jgi:hypothetical protein
MIRPGRNMRYNATAGNTGNDTDALQTDVMRFMSILGLCLMAVFALVQSIPLQETVSLRQEPERDKLPQDIASRQERARLLQSELNQLTAQKTAAQQALSSAQAQLTQVVDQTMLAHSKQHHLKAELEVLRDQLAQGRNKLARIQQAAQRQAQPLRKLQPEPGEEHKKPDDTSQRTTILKQQQASSPPAPASEQRPPPVPVPVKNGFTLRFASDEALERQLKTGAVSLYAMADKQAWRLSLGHGSPAFSPDTFPKWFHEMASSTVPVRYLQALEKSLNPSARPSIVWGVQLPPVTKRGIASLTRDRQGGNLVIAADGKVTLAPE